jgi:hypothetical protein
MDLFTVFAGSDTEAWREKMLPLRFTGDPFLQELQY